MIASLAGSVSALAPAAVVIEVSGVGYLVHVPSSTLARLAVGGDVRLLTHLAVREDAMTLYGFESADERDVFQTLIGVNGVGPKLALAVVGSLAPDGLRRAVASQDVDALTQVPGVGKRGAQRILLELKERLAPHAATAEAPQSALAEVREALLGLGYTPAELREVLERVPAGEDVPVEETLRAALRELSRV